MAAEPEKRIGEEDNTIALVESIAKIGALTGIVLYAIGLLVTNVYLADYGFTDFAIVKPQCIIVGAWTLALLCLASLPSVFFLLVASESKLQPRWRKVGAVGALVFGLYVATFLAFVFDALFLGTSVLTFVDLQQQELVYLKNGVPDWWALLVIMNAYWLLFFRANPSLNGPVWKYRTALVVMAIPFVIGSALVVGHDVFPYANREVGGGRPINAVIQFNSEGKEVVDRVRLLSKPYHDTDSPMSVVADILYATSDRYVVRVVSCVSQNKGLSYHSVNLMLHKKVVAAVYLYGAPAPDPRKGCPYSAPE